jgi:hypothetical protein
MTNMAQAVLKEHSHRPWWKRRGLWAIVLAAVLALIVVAVIEQTSQLAATPYGDFLDQLEAGNVASVSFRGTEIDGQFKKPLNATASNSTAQTNMFRTRVPDFGDPTLIPELRRQHVAIDVVSSTSWLRLLGRRPVANAVFHRSHPRGRADAPAAWWKDPTRIGYADASDARNGIPRFRAICETRADPCKVPGQKCFAIIRRSTQRHLSR